MPGVAAAVGSTSPPVQEPGGVRAVATAGPALLARDLTWGIEASFEVGLSERIELAAPLALGIRLIDAGQGSAIYIGVGVVDLSVTQDARVLYSPAIAFAGHARMGAESALRAAFDLTGVEEGLANGDHPLWMRGSLGFIIDVGPWLTIGGGIAYQHLVLGDEAPDGTEWTGWVSDSRFSVGAVRSQPFYDLPTFSVHVTRFLDIVVIATVDVDMETRTTDQRWLLGVELNKR